MEENNLKVVKSGKKNKAKDLDYTILENKENLEKY